MDSCFFPVLLSYVCPFVAYIKSYQQTIFVILWKSTGQTAGWGSCKYSDLYSLFGFCCLNQESHKFCLTVFNTHDGFFSEFLYCFIEQLEFVFGYAVSNLFHILEHLGWSSTHICFLLFLRSRIHLFIYIYISFF